MNVIKKYLIEKNYLDKNDRLINNELNKSNNVIKWSFMKLWSNVIQKLYIIFMLKFRWGTHEEKLYIIYSHNTIYVLYNNCYMLFCYYDNWW